MKVSSALKPAEAYRLTPPIQRFRIPEHVKYSPDQPQDHL